MDAIRRSRRSIGSAHLPRLGLVVSAALLLLVVGCRGRSQPQLADPAPSEENVRGSANVLHVRAVENADGTWTFHVTLEHPDIGWEDYADGWDIVLPDSRIINPDPGSEFTRPLLHPHETEQPFTRSQSGIRVPSGVTQVRVRAHDLVDGFGGREVTVDLDVSSGPDFEVERR